MSDEFNNPPDDNPIELIAEPAPTPDVPPEPRSPKTPTPKRGGDRNSQNNTFEGELNSGRTSFEGIHQEAHYYFNQNQAFPSMVFRQFSFREIWPLAAERQAEIAELFVGDPEEIGRLRSLLVSKRILVLSGETELGKTTAAIYLGSRLSAASSKNGNENSLDTYLIPSLDRHTRIDLNEIWGTEEVTSRVVIFKNVFARGNQELRSFLAQLTEYNIDEFEGKLRESNSYLIFTTTTGDAAKFLSGYAATDLQHELKHLTEDLLSQGLEKRLAHLERTRKPAAERLERLRNPDQKKTVVTGLKTMPRVVGFVEDYLRSNSTIAIDADLSEAARQFGDITSWFQKELAADFDVWCFTLALGLTHWAADSEGVPWFEFEYVHRGIAQYLRRDPQLFPQKKDAKEPEPLEGTPNLTDDTYLAQGRAEVVKDPESLGDVVRFCQKSYPQKLWEIFLKHHRRILTTLLPRLRDLAENKSAGGDSRPRELCAQIIGRVGEIDPERVTLSVMNRWINSDDVSQRANVGALYQGILASNNERYKSYFLEVLNSLTASLRPSDKGNSEAERKETKEKLLTAIAVYSRIGAYDLSLAMTGLKSIARHRLVTIVSDVQRISRIMESAKNEAAKATSAQEAQDILAIRKMLKDVTERLYNQEASAFVGVQYALCSLCLSADPISVFKELRLWIESSNQATGALVALMFLIEDGIASTLESMKVEVSGSESGFAEPKSCNPITAALTSGKASGKESVIEMARFLVTIFEAFSVTFFLPKEFQDYLRKSYLAHLTTWIEEALPLEGCREAMEELLTELMRIHKRVLYKPIDNLLSSPAFLKRDPELKKDFVNAVLWPAR